MNKEYFTIKTSYANYVAEIWHQYPTVDKVYIGARKKCVSFSVYLDEEGRPIEEEPPQLDGFGFNQHCNISGNHIKGIGSVHLLKTAMRFIVSHYKLREDTSFQFSDTSFIECIRYHMPLSTYYMIFYNNTWYESKFDATPMYISKHELETPKQALKDYLSGKPDISSHFMKHQSALKDKVHQIYSETSSLNECLNILKQEDCNIFVGWLQSICLQHIPKLQGTTWMIQNKLPKNAISYTKLQQKPNDLFELKGGTGLYFRRDEP